MVSDTASVLSSIGSFVLGSVIGAIATREWERIQDEAAAKQIIAEEQAGGRPNYGGPAPSAFAAEEDTVPAEPVVCPTCTNEFETDPNRDRAQCPKCSNTFRK
jgi:hypothetical protein